MQAPSSGAAPGPGIFNAPKKVASCLKTAMSAFAYGVAKKTLPKVLFSEEKKDMSAAGRPATEALHAEVCACTCLHAREADSCCAHKQLSRKYLVLLR